MLSLYYLVYVQAYIRREVAICLSQVILFLRRITLFTLNIGNSFHNLYKPSLDLTCANIPLRDLFVTFFTLWSTLDICIIMTFLNFLLKYDKYSSISIKQ